MASMLGCGGQASPEDIASITKTLQPMWRTLPKISNGRIDRRSLRYLVHRYFMQAQLCSVYLKALVHDFQNFKSSQNGLAYSGKS